MAFYRGCTALMVFLAVAGPVNASVHLWQITELYSNADGSVQYIELHNDFNGEQFFATNQTRFLSKDTANTTTFDTYLFSTDSPAPTADRFLLIGTENLSSIAGVTPDFILPADFLQTGGGRLELFSPLFSVIDFSEYPALPGGNLAFHQQDAELAPGTPTNFAGMVGTLPQLVPGDFDGDGDVDGADFVVWQTNFPTGSGASLATGDADGDGDVDGADFVIWQTNFPTTPSGSAASPVPEPGALLSALFGIAVLTTRLRHGHGFLTRHRSP